MNKINWLIFFSIALLASSCTKVEIEPYNCEGAPKPTISPLSSTAKLGDIVSLSISSSNTVYCKKPDGKVSTVTSPFKIYVNNASQSGNYAFYSVSSGCPSDSVKVNIQVNPNINVPCTHSSYYYSYNGNSYPAVYKYYYYDYNYDYSQDYGLYMRFDDNSSASDIITLVFRSNEFPTENSVYFIDPTYSVDKNAGIVVEGYNNGNSWSATSGKVYCQFSGTDVYFTLCDVKIKVNNTFYTLNGKLVL